MWDQKLRRLTEEGFKRRPQSPLRLSRARFHDERAAAAPTQVDVADYAGIGAELKAERERQGRSLTDAAAALHIQQRYLEAIEAGRFDDLPGPTYVTGFLRSYGRYIGADPGAVVAAFRRESSMPLGPTKLVAPEAIAEPRRPRATVVLVSLLAAAVLYAGWTYFNDNAIEFGDLVSPAPERLLSLLGADTSPTLPETGSPAGGTGPTPDMPAAPTSGPRLTAPTTSDAAALTAREAQRDADALVDVAASGATGAKAPPAGPGAPSPAAPADRDASLKSPVEVGEDTPPETPVLERLEVASPMPPLPQPSPVVVADATALPPPPPSSGGGGGYVPQRFGGGDTDARVVVRAKVDSWVQIQGGRNEMLLTRILRPGDTFYAPNRGDLMLTTGNVGGLEIIVDGEPLGPLGPMGAVRRNISLDAERLLAMAGGREQRR